MTDGGHYDNLGLVEVLRHRCRVVFCIDASGDTPPVTGALADAITLAHEELGIEIKLNDQFALVPGSGSPLDPVDPLTALSARLSREVVITGQVIYPESFKYDGEEQIQSRADRDREDTPHPGYAIRDTGSCGSKPGLSLRQH